MFEIGFNMISVAILTKDSSRTLQKTLESVTSFPEVILLDTGSTDTTLSIAKTYPNVRIFKREFTGFGSLRNEAAALAQFDWILALDSDEVLSPALSKEILGIKPERKTLYNLPFHNFYRGKLVKCCGWYPESHIRLYNKRDTSFRTNQVHEGIDDEGFSIITCNHHIYHTPYLSQKDFLRKMQLYTDLFASQNQGKKSSFLKALIHGSGAFLKSYLLKRGVFYGEVGFTLSLYQANTAFYKYLKLRDANAPDTVVS